MVAASESAVLFHRFLPSHHKARNICENWQRLKNIFLTDKVFGFWALFFGEIMKILDSHVTTAEDKSFIKMCKGQRPKFKDRIIDVIIRPAFSHERKVNEVVIIERSHWHFAGLGTRG